MKKIIVISAHPDDETLGVGGTLLKSFTAGNRLFWLNITGISTKHPYGYTEQEVRSRGIEIEEVRKAYNFEKQYSLNIPTQLVDTENYGKLIKQINNVFQEIRPNIIYLPNRSDVHTDHQIVFQAIYSCTKSFRNPQIVRILMYETLSETEFAPALTENAFIPNVFIDISEHMEKKLEIMSIYKSEIMEGNKPRSFNAIKALAAYRGSRIGVDYAEAFMLLYEKL